MTLHTQLCLRLSKGPSHVDSVMMALALLLSLSPRLNAQRTAGSGGANPPDAAAPHVTRPTAGRGPVLTSFEIAQGAILLHFTQTQGGLYIEGRGRNAFEIAGADHVWYAADAHVVNGVVVVSTSLVQEPATVRYRGHSSTGSTLSNGAGLTAEPFQTDN